MRRDCGESTSWGNVVGIDLCGGYELANRPQAEDQNKSVKNNLMGNEMNPGDTAPCLLGMQLLRCCRGYKVRLYWGTCSVEERLCRPLGDEDS